MSHEPNGLQRLGGISFIVAGALFLSKYLLDLVAGPPPSSGAEILAWIGAHRTSMAIANEVLFFAVAFLIPAVVSLFDSLVRLDRAKAVIGCGLLAVAIPVLAVLDIVHGRLVYPVYDLQLTPVAAELVVAVF